MKKTFLKTIKDFELSRKLKSKYVVSFLLATVLPVLVFGYVALNKPISFDGALNLQVAENLAEDGDYARYYEYKPDHISAGSGVDWKRYHPYEVQTNGVYVFLASFGIKVLGENQFAYQFASLFFIFLISLAIWLLLKKWLLVATIAPVLILFSLPSAFSYSIGGLGEIPGIAFILLALFCLVKGMESKKEKILLRNVFIAMIFIGAAINIKTYFVGFLPVFALGLFIIYLLKRPRLKMFLLSLTGILIPPFIFEVVRLINLGIYKYLLWWKNQLLGVSYQAGLNKAEIGRFSNTNNENVLDKAIDHFILFSNKLGLDPKIFALLVIFVAIATLVVTYYLFKKSLPKKFIPEGFLIGLFSCFSFIYLAWWTLSLPDSGTFTRRAIPSIITLLLAMIIIICFFTSNFSEFRKKLGSKTFYLLSIAVSIILIILVSITMKNSLENFRVIDSPGAEGLKNYQNASSFINSSSNNNQYFGIGWWSAPVISLMSDIDFHNLQRADVCSLDENSYLVWDATAKGIRSIPSDRQGKVSYVLYKEYGSSVSIYRIKPNEQYCSQNNL